MSTTLERTTFTTNRALEFFTEKELQMQIGHGREMWAIALVKELIDNALDACETAGRAPEIVVAADAQAVSVLDNGPGLPLNVLDRSLDYLVRVSDKNHYISPTRGQLGNALKCVWAAPFVYTGQRGRVDVITGGDVHQIDVELDRIGQQPALRQTVYPDGVVKNGTLVRMHWPDAASHLENDETSDFYNANRLSALCANYSAFNPHASFAYSAQLAHPADLLNQHWPATAPDWKKWRTDSPTSPHWYTTEQLRNLIAAYVKAERDGGRVRTVREFVSEFRGLSATAKQKEIVDAAGMAGMCLHDLVSAGDIDSRLTATLLAAMQGASKAVKPEALGVIGEEHLAAWLQRFEASPESIRYKKIAGTAAGRPFVVEVALGVHAESYNERRVVVGLNGSPTLRSPLGALDRLLGENRVDSWDPVLLVVHLASPHFQFTDRGKSQLALDHEMRAALVSAVETVTKTWKQAKRHADREGRLRESELDELRKTRRRQELSIKDAAYAVMEEAYLKASGGGTLPANARQIMYAARPLVLELTGGRFLKDANNFGQKYLPAYMEDFPTKTANWDVIYDARGKLIEPHNDTRVDLGTLEVRRYVSRWTNSVRSPGGVTLDHRVETGGPANRYGYALFVEKEGFNELLQHGKIAERYDMAIMSTKGMSTTASRNLVARLSDAGVTILVLHDFDKAGFSILHTLRSDTRRWQYRQAPNVVNLGLRIEDVVAMNLQSEPVEYDSSVDPRINLRQSGASEDECRYLVQGMRHGRWFGERVELNAMTSDQFLSWLRQRLDDVGVAKMVPAEDALQAAYEYALQRAHIQKAIDEANANYERRDVTIPDALADEVKRRIAGTSSAWDDAIFEIACEELAE